VNRPDAEALRVNIISWDGGGLGTHVDILSEALWRLGCHVSFKGRRVRRPRHRIQSLAMSARVLLAQRWAKLTGRRAYDVNFFIETIFPEFLPMGRVNCLIPDPEFFRDENYRHLPKLDWVLGTTSSGVAAFEALKVPARLIHFSSPDKRIAGRARGGPLRCFHIAGASSLKGTEAVVEVWSRHPEWPELTVVRHTRRYGGGTAPPLAERPNIRYLTEYLPEAALAELQNDCAVHVLPSQAEGYGHGIGEAMSCGAVVVTTDAPPMNELVGTDRGVLVRVARSEPMRLSKKNFVDLDDLESKLQQVLDMSAEARESLGRKARAWYEAQATRFEQALMQILVEARLGPR